MSDTYDAAVEVREAISELAAEIRESILELGTRPSLRDTFAAAALTGILAESSGREEVIDPFSGAKIAYHFADAMLAQREKQRE